MKGIKIHLMLYYWYNVILCMLDSHICKIIHTQMLAYQENVKLVLTISILKVLKFGRFDRPNFYFLILFYDIVTDIQNMYSFIKKNMKKS